MFHRGSVLTVLALALPLLLLPTPALAQTEEDTNPWRFMWEEAKWGSISAFLTMLGFGALMAPTCELICSAVPDPLAQEECLWNCGTVLGGIGFLTVPLGAAAGVTWTAWRHEIDIDLRHFAAAYGGGLLIQSLTVVILTRLRYPEFLLGPIGAGLAVFTLSAANGLGAALGFNLGLGLWPISDGSREGEPMSAEGVIELSVQLASF